tara:strand:+ start:3982 stop:4722 length:741 start_codon:yes stop_codon:yes gene_type:complete
LSYKAPFGCRHISTDNALRISRLTTTVEVAISKIIPAGACWQGSSILASNMNIEPTQVEFFMTTGCGESLGVFAGHNIYNFAKKQLVDESIDMKESLQTGIWLSTAACCSGFVWQPIVNFWQAVDAPFNVVFMNTWLGCGAIFLAGLRVGRLLYPFIPGPDYENLKRDITLSTSIGGAIGVFVGTDITYLAHENWLGDFVGICNTDEFGTSCAKAGISTSTGFMLTQGILNEIYPKNRLWNDPLEK